MENLELFCLIYKQIQELIEAGKEFYLRGLLNLIEPIDKTNDYDRALEMLQMSVDDVVEISDTEFQCFVQDQWAWTQQAFMSNTKYLK